jgi:NAD(P)-dependent dehydrogenase (short-subunit alcohol dehydrogenase family)
MTDKLQAGESLPEDASEASSTKAPISRRAVMTGVGVAAAATAAGIAGLAGGIGVGAHEVPPAPTAVSPKQRFADKVVMITGATSGIGRAAAIAFAREGARVAFCGRRESLGHDVEREIRDKGGAARYFRADVRIEADVQRFADFTVSEFGRIDAALNNAGVTLEKPLHEYTGAEWDDVLNTNLRGVFYAIKYQVPVMLAGRGGTIVVTSSSNAIATQGKRGAYAASKRGLIALVQAAALEYGEHNIRVNAILPGTTDTALVRRVAGMENVPDPVWHAAAAEWAKGHLPGLGRMANPQEIAEFALALASDEHPYLTGASLVIDGGKTAQGG